MKKLVGLCVLSACIALPMAVQAKTVCLKVSFGAYVKIYGLKNTAKIGSSSAVNGWVYGNWWSGPIPLSGTVVGRGDGTSALYLTGDTRIAGFSAPLSVIGQSVNTKALAGPVKWDEGFGVDNYDIAAVSCKEADTYLKDNL